MNIEYEKINAKINFNIKELDMIVNSLQNMVKINIYSSDWSKSNVDYKQPFYKLISDLKDIRVDLIVKYNDAIAENNISTESINPDYSREC
mgnify:FL=1